METHLYLSLIPEALILSHLPPEKFGNYLATGSKRQIEGPAVFFEVDQSAQLGGFRIDEARARCLPHPDGSPRKSTYIAVYNVLPNVPLSALKSAYLTTPSGLSLKLEKGEPTAPAGDSFYLYQELGPVYPRVASRLAPEPFCELVTSPTKLVSLPRIAFIDMKLGALAANPAAALDGSMPYQNLDHLRDCLAGIRDNPERMTKIVNRGLRPDILFSMIRTGLYLGDTAEFCCFPMPSEEALEKNHNLWWHSAQSVRGY